MLDQSVQLSRRHILQGVSACALVVSVNFGCSGKSNHLSHGIDVSAANGVIDWHSVRRAGIQFVYIKSTEGKDLTDDQYATNVWAAREAGLIVGAYHVFISEDKGQVQADFFLSSSSIEAGDLPPMLDIENKPVPQLADTILHDIEAWLAAVTDTLTNRFSSEARPSVYLRSEVWTSLGQPSWSRYPLWLAEWDTTSPVIPVAWSNFAFWQYTDQGRIAGIDGAVDLSHASELAHSSRLAL